MAILICLSGNTHEDIDALFGVIRRFLVGMSWRNVAEFEKLVRDSLANYPGQVVVEVVAGTLDLQSWFEADSVHNAPVALLSAWPRKRTSWDAPCSVLNLLNERAANL